MSQTLWLLWASRTPAQAEKTRGLPTNLRSPSPSGPPHGGPICPDPALRAWGQEDRQRNAEHPKKTHVFPVASPPANDDESERMVIGRLIRRMRISDSPTRFQGLATSASSRLRWAWPRWPGFPEKDTSRSWTAARSKASALPPLQSIPPDKSGRPVPRGQRGDPPPR